MEKLARYTEELVARLTMTNQIAGFDRLFVTLLRALAHGRPVAPAALAHSLDWPLDRVIAALQEVISVEWDDEGHVVGYGLTLRETPHMFDVGGRRLYTWCAFDTVFFPTVLGQSAQVSSRCPVTGKRVALTITPDEIQAMEPADAVISLILPQAAQDIRHAFCCHVHFFASAPAGEEWARNNPDTDIVSIKEAFASGRERAQRLLGSV